MFRDARTSTPRDATPSDDAQLLSELAANTSADVQAKRLHPRFTVALPVAARPGNFSDRSRGDYVGRTVDISQGGCLVIFDAAVRVGDVYALDLDRSRTKLPLIYGRCVRARMLHDDAIEAGFSFFTALDPAELTVAIRRVTDAGSQGVAA